MVQNNKCLGCGALDPCGCSDPGNDLLSTSQVKYVGPNLPGTGIQSCEDLTTILQIIDAQILAIKEIITPTPPPPSTTTTTSTSSTTTSTTTGAPFYSWYLGGLSNLSSPCSSSILLPPLYTSSPVLTNGVILYTNSSLTTPYVGYPYITNLGTKWTVASGGVLSAATSC
jgi:hypothetical protein